MQLRTKAQKEREARDQKIRKMHAKLTADPANAKTAVREVVMEKFGLKSMKIFYGVINQNSKQVVQGNEAVGSGVNPRV